MEVDIQRSNLLDNEINDSDSVEENNYGIYKVHDFKFFKSIWAIISLMFVYIILSVAVLPIDYYCSLKHCSLSSLSIAVYCNVATWIITFVFCRYFEFSNEKLWRYGYGHFYRSIATISQIPFIIFSLGNATILLYVIILKDCDIWSDNHFNTNLFVGIQIIVGFQTMLAFIFLFIYLARTMQFNASKNMPDVFNKMCHVQEVNSLNHQTTGSRNRTLLESMLELQADQIYYLQNRCTTLAKTLHQLSHQSEQDEDLLQA